MELLFFISFLLLKQFYIFPSGSIGLADLCLGVSGLVIVGKQIREYQKYKKEGLSGRLILHKIFNWEEDKFLYIFLACVVIINSVYTCRERSIGFVKYSVYWLYNGMAIWCFRYIGREQNFKKYSVIAVRTNILLQTGIWISGRGRLFHEYWGGTRYMGTFNDPNQLAFFLFMMILLLYLLKEKGQIWDSLFYGMAIAVIAASKSTGIFLGVLVFGGCLAAKWMYGIYRADKLPRQVWRMGTAIFLISITAGLWVLWPDADFSIQEGNFTLVERIQEKIWKISQDGAGGILMDRGLDKLIQYPQYVIFGAGEGGFARFSASVQINEIHCCLFSILFCYGIVPTGILLAWLGRQLKALEGWMCPAAVALLSESFLLINYRQPLFWLILMYGAVVGERGEIQKRGCKMKPKTPLLY